MNEYIQNYENQCRCKYVEHIESVGMELEYTGVPRGAVCNTYLRSLGFTHAHDASVEGVLPHINNIPILTEQSINSFSKNSFGGELVSPILYTKDENSLLEYITAVTWAMNEFPVQHRSLRASIHFHIDYTGRISTLKNLLRLSAHLEQVFFAVGGMGYVNRGNFNEYIYCRPITGKGPVCVPTSNSGKYAQVFNLQDLYEIESPFDFWFRYGNLNYFVQDRYVPVRYHWLNLTRLSRNQSTAEFRIFNLTLDPIVVWSALLFSKRVAEFALENSSVALEQLGVITENSVFTEHTPESVLETFDNFAKYITLPQLVLNTLRRLIINSIPIKIMNEYVFCHLDSRIHFAAQTRGSAAEYKPLVIKDKIHRITPVTHRSSNSVVRQSMINDNKLMSDPTGKSISSVISVSDEQPEPPE